MSIDWSKPVQTRDGRKVEIKFTDGRGSYPITGYIGNETGLTSWKPDGSWKIDPCCNDLFNVPEPKVIGVLNCYDSMTCHELTHKEANLARSADCTHIVTIYRQPDGSVTAEVEELK